MKKLFTTVVVLILLNAATAYGTTISGSTSVCTGKTTTLSIDTVGGTWSSSDTEIATVNPSTGVVTGVYTGGVTIMYTLPSASWSVTFGVNANPVAITGPGAVCAGGTAGLANVMGSGTWSSASPTVATIGKWSGLLTAVAPGTTVITYTMYTGCYTTRVQSVNVVPSAVTGASAIHESVSTTMTATPAGGTWTSTPPGIVSVDSAGVATGISPGVATIKYTLGGCTSTKGFTVLGIPAGVNSTVGNVVSFSVFPNPNSGALTITSASTGIAKIYSIEGRAVVTQAITATTTNVNLPSGLSAGIYICQFTGDDGSSITERFVYKP